jgi:hypothetical protein
MGLTVGQWKRAKRAKMAGKFCVGFAVVLTLCYGCAFVRVQAQIADYAELDQMWETYLGIKQGMDHDTATNILNEKLNENLENTSRAVGVLNDKLFYIQQRHAYLTTWRNPLVDLGARMATFSEPCTIRSIVAFWPAVVQILTLVSLGAFLFWKGKLPNAKQA